MWLFKQFWEKPSHTRLINNMKTINSTLQCRSYFGFDNFFTTSFSHPLVEIFNQFFKFYKIERRSK